MSKVLFIEDSRDWQDILRKLLETAGHEAYHAPNLDIAISLISSKQHFDGIIFDLRLGEEPSVTTKSFAWLDALIQGMVARKQEVPPIIIVTGIAVTKKDIVFAFTEYKEFIYGFFEKRDLNPKEFLKLVKSAATYSSSTKTSKKSFLTLFIYTMLMTAIMLLTFGVLSWTVQQISDPQTQQTILQVGGAVIVVIAIFITVFSQNTKLENFIEAISKIWRG